MCDSKETKLETRGGLVSCTLLRAGEGGDLRAVARTPTGSEQIYTGREIRELCA